MSWNCFSRRWRSVGKHDDHDLLHQNVEQNHHHSQDNFAPKIWGNILETSPLSFLTRSFHLFVLSQMIRGKVKWRDFNFSMSKNSITRRIIQNIPHTCKVPTISLLSLSFWHMVSYIHPQQPVKSRKLTLKYWTNRERWVRKTVSVIRSCLLHGRLSSNFLTAS